MQGNIRLSQPALRILRLFEENPGNVFSGAEIAKSTGTGSGTLYPLLARLESNGWAMSVWEEVEPHEVGRPRRRLYKLTDLGRIKTQEALAELQVPALPRGLAWNV